MAKKILVAKRNFDDGSKKGPAGKSVDYKPGEQYLGSEKEAKALVSKGLLCDENEFKMKDVVIDAKQAEIDALNVVLEDRNKVIVSLEEKIAELTKQLAGN